MPEMDEDRLLRERDHHEGWLTKQPGVTGVGIGLGRSGNKCVVIYTDHMPASVKEQIRQRLQSVPIDFEETGELRAF